MAEKGKNGGRDYKQEYADYHGKPDQIAKRAQRNAARREVEKRSGPIAPGKEVDHKNPLRKGGTNRAANLRVVDADANKGWRKGKKGYD